MSVEFVDNRIKVKAAVKEACIAYLYEAAGEIHAQTVRNSSAKGNWFTDIKNSWAFHVNESKLEAQIGNPLQAAIWAELGTGEYALNKNGRKGYWVYVKDSDGSSPISSETGGKHYTLQEARRAVRYLREKGLDAHYTKGQKPKRTFFRAYTSVKPILKKRAEDVFKGRFA